MQNVGGVMTMGDFERGSFRKREGGRSRDSRGGRSEGGFGGHRDGGFGGGRREGGFRGGGFGGGRREFSRADKEMTSVKCDKCGEMCEVPFKPTGDKPVYCSTCFRKNDSGSDFSSRSSSGSGSGVSKSDIIEINNKLDRILAILEREQPEE
jgi:CxxC-x17-CxxC domain-containing protein